MSLEPFNNGRSSPHSAAPRLSGRLSPAVTTRLSPLVAASIYIAWYVSTSPLSSPPLSFLPSRRMSAARISSLRAQAIEARAWALKLHSQLQHVLESLSKQMKLVE